MPPGGALDCESVWQGVSSSDHNENMKDDIKVILLYVKEKRPYIGKMRLAMASGGVLDY